MMTQHPNCAVKAYKVQTVKITLFTGTNLNLVSYAE